MDAWLDLRVHSKKQLTPSVMMLELVSMTPVALPRFLAGSYIDIQIPGEIFRPYSLCNGPQDTNRYVIAVKRESFSRGASAFLHDRVKVGDMLRVRSPLNEFSLDKTASFSALFGGGVGIAPLLSMAADLWHRGAAFEMHMSARHQQSAPFAEQLMCSPFKSRVHFHWSEQASGRLNFERCFRRLSSLSHIYLCGPASYMADAKSAVVKSGHSQERIHFEHF